MIGIYQIKCLINNQIYIGQSVNIEQRLSQHKCDLRHNRHSNSHLQCSANKYGIENFEFTILKTISEDEYSQNTLDNLEKEFISKYKSSLRGLGYNIESGGKSKGHISEETKIKIKNANLGKKFGKRSEKTKNLMRMNHSHYWKGKHLSYETKEKIRIGNLGKKSPLKGRHLSSAHKKKIANSQLGCIWVYKNNESHFIKQDKLCKYLSDGFILGRPYFTRKKSIP